MVLVASIRLADIGRGDLASGEVAHNNKLHRINLRCQILCMEPHKIRHRKFPR